jgi:hypothetical protein
MENNDRLNGLSEEDKAMNEQIMKTLDTLRVQCPVHKLNLNDDNKQAIAGRYLLTFVDVEEILSPLAQMSDVTDDTILFFDNRHVAETIQLFYGMSGILVDTRFVSKETQKKFIADVVELMSTNRIMTYKQLKNSMDTIHANSFAAKGIKEITMKNLKTIMRLIWFVPYAKIDGIADQIIEQYRKAHPDEFKQAMAEVNNERKHE